jgi:hypothetical protein
MRNRDRTGRYLLAWQSAHGRARYWRQRWAIAQAQLATLETGDTVPRVLLAAVQAEADRAADTLRRLEAAVERLGSTDRKRIPLRKVVGELDEALRSPGRMDMEMALLRIRTRQLRMALAHLYRQQQNAEAATARMVEVVNAVGRCQTRVGADGIEYVVAEDVRRALAPLTGYQPAEQPLRPLRAEAEQLPAPAAGTCQVELTACRKGWAALRKLRLGV